MRRRPKIAPSKSSRLRGLGAPLPKDVHRGAPDCELLDAGRFAAEWCLGPPLGSQLGETLGATN